MAAIMLIVAVSRGLVVPVYLMQLDMLELDAGTASWLKVASFWFLVLALCVGGFIIIGAMLRGQRAVAVQERQRQVLHAK
jgi:hypothetical protein